MCFRFWWCVCTNAWFLLVILFCRASLSSFAGYSVNFSREVIHFLCDFCVSVCDPFLPLCFTLRVWLNTSNFLFYFGKLVDSLRFGIIQCSIKMGINRIAEIDTVSGWFSHRICMYSRSFLIYFLHSLLSSVILCFFDSSTVLVSWIHFFLRWSYLIGCGLLSSSLSSSTGFCVSC